MGPLNSLKILEIASIGPGPFCCMMLADMGAEVVRTDRPGVASAAALDPLLRNRKSILCDLKSPQAAAVILRLVENFDGLVEGFRPGVMERLGLGPEACLQRNPGLVYGRMTGWGQEGPLAQTAGHDINYISISGVLHEIGLAGGKPTVPLNLVGDFGGGGMLLAFGMVCALLEAKISGRGQVVDAAMIDGSSTLMALFHGFKAMGLHKDGTGTSFLAGAAHYYDTYETRDGRFVSIGAIEPQFYALLIEKLGLDRKKFALHGFDWTRLDGKSREVWKELKLELARVFKTRSRDEWCALLEGSDTCFTPVLSMSEAIEHPHNKSRNAFVDVAGNPQPAPAPRFSRSVAAAPLPGAEPGANTREVLADAGFSEQEIKGLIEEQVIV